METYCYQEITAEVSKKPTQKAVSEENNLVHRATLIDQDIAGIVQHIGLARLSGFDVRFKFFHFVLMGMKGGEMRHGVEKGCSEDLWHTRLEFTGISTKVSAESAKSR